MGRIHNCVNVVTPAYIHADTVNIVSGLPRSGTSMMMRMLDKGGLDPVTDNIRTKDEMNPNGYYELEAVKDPGSYNDWLKNSVGKSVKVVSRFLTTLPATHYYKVVFMHRSLAEIIRSQGSMASQLTQDGARTAIDEKRLAQVYTHHLAEIIAWLDDRPNFSVLDVHYEDVLNAPLEHSHRIARFLDAGLNPVAMASVVDGSLNHGVR